MADYIGNRRPSSWHVYTVHIVSLRVSIARLLVYCLLATRDGCLRPRLPPQKLAPALQRVSPSRVTRIQARISDDSPHPSLQASRLVSSSTVLYIYGVTS